MSDTDMNGLEIRALDPEDGRAISDAIDLLLVLGEGYLPVEKLLHHARHHVVMGAFHRNELAGVVVAHPLNSQDFETLERRMGSERLASLSLLRKGKTGTVDALAVKESYRRMGKGQGPGIGSRLLVEAVSGLKDSGCQLFFGESWVSGSGDESKSLGARLGGELQLEVPGYWNSDGVYCPVHNRFIYMSRVQKRKLLWRGYDFKSVPYPSALLKKKKESFGIRTEDRRGLQVKVTDLERTMVDVFDRPDLGGWLGGNMAQPGSFRLSEPG